MKKYLWLFLTALCSYIFYFFSLPPSTPYTPPPLPVQEQLLFVPLDSRPPCTLMAQDLGRLASIDVILPPKELLDNYRTPANREKLSSWLSHNAGQCPAVISGDLLIHGGLLASRLPQGTVNDEQNFFKLLQAIPSTSLQAIFSPLQTTPRAVPTMPSLLSRVSLLSFREILLLVSATMMLI